MDLSELSLQQAPPFRAVYRFFLTAPWFLVLAGFYLVFAPDDLFESHIGSKIVGFVHLVTLGFLTMTMMGALMQMLPVMVGVILPKPELFSRAVYYSYMPGALLFSAGFYFDNRTLILAAFTLLFVSVSLYCLVVLYALFARKLNSATSRSMKTAVASLLIGASSGLTLLLAYIFGFSAAFEPGLFNLHLFWVLGGWALGLIMTVSFRIIPMFYVTPNYPSLFADYAGILLFSVITLFSFTWVLPESWAQNWKQGAGILWGLLGLAYAIITLMRLSKRKRKLPDKTLLYWKFSMGSLAALCVLWISDFFIRVLPVEKFFLISGIFYLLVFAAGIVQAMMFKIIPFLSWFHPAGKGIMETPNMKEQLPDYKITLQFYFFVLFIVLLLGGLVYPFLLKAAGVALIFQSVYLYYNLLKCVGIYKIYIAKVSASI